MSPVIFLILLILLAALALSAWRAGDRRADRQAMKRLSAMQTSNPALFEPEMVATLPDPVRRYFLYTIAPGTPLYSVAQISMQGQFGMGSKENPGYMAMTATQVLACPTGFVWQMTARRGWLLLSGSDSESWTRFWLMGLLPVARMGGDQDHARAAFGRYVAEAVFWTPAALLPGPGVHWEAVDAQRARVTVRHDGLEQVVELLIAPDGQPLQVHFERWSDANTDKKYRLQPFGGYLTVFREFSGFRLPTHIEAGNHFGSEKYFPFFMVDVNNILFVPAD